MLVMRGWGRLARHLSPFCSFCSRGVKGMQSEGADVGVGSRGHLEHAGEQVLGVGATPWLLGQVY